MSTVQELLNKTSRTFALAIPLLPEPTRTNVTIAYLVFRIVDTLEDAENHTPRARLNVLEEVESLPEDPTTAKASALAHKWSALKPTADRWYGQLLADMPLVLGELTKREPFIQRIILDHARRTARGMASFLDHGGTLVQSVGELQRYCYFVAGIVRCVHGHVVGPGYLDLDGVQDPAGGDAAYVFYLAAVDILVRILFPHRRHAAVPAVCE